MTETPGAREGNVTTPAVYVVDDDASLREALLDLFRSTNMPAIGFGSAAAFLESVDPTRPGCILLDIRLPGVSGLDFQRHLEDLGYRLPVVFITGHADIPMSVRAMKAGAVDFLTKPFREQDVLDAVSAAIQKDAFRRQESAQIEQIASLVGSLTPRERDVMARVIKGLMNKQIAFELGISEITVKLHRGNVMRKMEVRTVADLVRKAELAGVR